MRQQGGRRAWGAGALLLLGLVGLAGRGLAAGPSPLEGYPLAYQGQAFVDGVAAANQSLLVTVTAFDDVANVTSALCSTVGQVQTDAAGHFQLLLNASCGPKLVTSPEIWLQVQVESQVPLLRVRLGAVPYAAQAAHAATADSATFGDDLLPGASLGDQLDGLLPSRLTGPIGATYSADGLYVGPLPSDSPGDFGLSPHGGYRAANGQCSQAYGAGAHLCTPQEMLRSATLGLASQVGGAPGHRTQGWLAGAMSSDCNGFTHADNQTFGASWDFATGTGSASPCDASLAVLCCQ